MNRFLQIVLVLAFFGPEVLAEEEKKTAALTDPVEILKKMDEAAKAVKTVAYDVEYDATGAAAKLAPAGKGSVILAGWRDGRVDKFRIDAEARANSTQEIRRLTAGCDGENYYLIDYAAKTVYEDIDPNVMGSSGRLAFSAQIPEFVHPEPFSDEINGKDHALKGIEKVGDEECYVVTLEYAAVKRKATWYISTRDFLPRRRIDHFEIPNAGSGDVRKTITRLVIDPPLDDASFKLNVPEGFTKSDDFAP